MPKIAVIAGGFSDERAVSLRSGAAVTAALKDAGYDADQLDLPAKLDDLQHILVGYDAVFPVVHGKGGEDGTLQSWLETHQIAYAGPDSAASKLCFDKWRYGQLLADNGFLMPQGELVTSQSWQQSAIVKGPFVLKPNDGGSSIDTFIVHQPELADQSAINGAFARHGEMLLQELIEGTEITIGVLLDEALPVIEIVPPSGQEFDYENKYNGATQEICPPQSVSEDLQTQARDISLKIHRLTGCRDFSRTDIILANDQLYILETNTIPGFTDQSLLPKAAAVAGYSMPNMVDMLVQVALARQA